MYTLPRNNYLKRSVMVGSRRYPAAVQVPLSHEDLVKNRLRELGVTAYGRRKFSSRYLPHIIHQDEYIGGVLYGQHEEGSAMIVATDKRVIFLDKKPLFVNQDEISYEVVSGVSYSHAGFAYTVTLHTRIKDYKIKTLNKQCAKGFISYLESRILEQSQKEFTS